MEMTIEELIENLSTIRNKICSGKYETETSLTFEQTFNIMHKYQKIEQIVGEKGMPEWSYSRFMEIASIVRG